MKSIEDQARDAKNAAIKLRDGKPPDYPGAVTILVDMLKIIQNELEAFKKESPERMVNDVEGKIALQGVHLNGSLGGIYRRSGELAKAIDVYAAGARIEGNLRYKLKETYTSTQHLVVRCLARPELIFEAAAIEDSVIRRELTDLRTRIARLSHGDVYKTADLAMVSLFLGHPEWRKNLTDFITMASNRSDGYARKVTLEVIQELAQQANNLRPEWQEQLSQWDEAEHWAG